ASIDDGSDVAGLHLVGADRRQHRVHPALQIQRILHAVDLRGVLQTAHVCVEPEADRSLRRRVASCALEYTAAVVDDVRRAMNRRVRPVQELSVHPNLAGRGKTHRALLNRILAYLVNWRVGELVSSNVTTVPRERESDSADWLRRRHGSPFTRIHQFTNPPT